MEGWSPFKRTIQEGLQQGLQEGAKGAVGALRSKGPSLMSPVSSYALTGSEKKAQENLTNSFRREAGKQLNSVKKKLFNNTPAANATPSRFLVSRLATPKAYTPKPMKVQYVSPNIFKTLGINTPSLQSRTQAIKPKEPQMQGGTRRRSRNKSKRRYVTLKRRRLY